MKLDAYVRVSRVNGRGGDSFISPKLQEERCRAMATARGAEIVEVITDLDQSGGTMQRPGLDRAIERIETGVSDGIVVARIDRFSRTLRGALDTLERIEASGGVLIECDGGWDTSTPTGRFGRDLILRIAQLYKEQIGQQWDDAKRHAVARGIHPTKAPIGYLKDPDTRRLVPDPTTADAIREAFKLRASGASWREVVEALVARGVTPAHGGHWSIPTIRKILTNPTYLGEARMSGHHNPAAHEPLVTRAIWLAAQAPNAPTRVARGGDGARLSGIVFCSCCGGRLTASLPARDKRDGRTAAGFYACRRLNSPRNNGCTAGARARMDHLDELVVAAFVDRYREEVGQLDDEPKPVETNELAHKLALATDARDVLLGDLPSLASLPSETRAQVLTDAQDAVNQAQSELDRVEVAATTNVLNRWTLGDYFTPEDIMELRVPEQRRLLTTAIARIVVHRGDESLPDRTVIEWKPAS